MATPATEQSDAALLRQFVRDGSEAAFCSLTNRHVDLVFGTAVRRTGDRGGAEEIAQNVFVALARKAAWLQNEASLAAWLHRTTVLESRQWWRGESRRRQREQTAAELETTMKASAENDPALSGALDEALLELREGDRQAVLLRFFEGRNHREIGAALDIGEDAARKRVDKAMQQMVASFRKRGLVVSSAAALAAILTGAASGAPAGLAVMILRAAAVSGGVTTVSWLAKILGLGRGQLAGLCLVTLLVPTVWQEARLVSARGEQRRMEVLLAEMQGQRQTVADELTGTRRQIRRASSRLARIENPAQPPRALADAGITHLDARLFLWDEAADYVRVPKSVMAGIAFGDRNDDAGLGKLPPDPKRVMDRVTGRLSPTLLSALGLGEAEQERVQEFCEGQLKEYRTFADSHGYATNSLPPGLSGVPESMRLNADSGVWVLPRMAEEGAAWRSRFEAALAAVAGSERAQIVLKQAYQDGCLSRCFQNFGAEEYLVALTPLPEGGCSISQRSFSRGSVTWKDWSGRISNLLKPDYSVGPLDRPIPEELKEHLRQWQAANPDVPDSPPK